MLAAMTSPVDLVRRIAILAAAGMNSPSVRLSAVDSGPVLEAHPDDAVHVAALVQVGKPLGGVLAGLLVPVDAGTGQGVQRSDANSALIVRLAGRGTIAGGCEAGSQSAKACFAGCYCG